MSGQFGQPDKPGNPRGQAASWSARNRLHRGSAGEASASIKSAKLKREIASRVRGQFLRLHAAACHGRCADAHPLRLRLTVPSDPEKQTTDDQEFLTDTQDIVETWRREAIQEGVEQGVKQGVAHSLVEVYEIRFGAMREDLRAVAEDTDDERMLLAWLRLAGTRSSDEIATAIRSSRAS
jgi:hypothetical protein